MSGGVPRTGARSRQAAAIYAWLLVFSWLAMILLLSSDAFSAPSTGSWLRPFLRWLFPDWSLAEIRTLHNAIRKAAHVGVYGVLALLAFRAIGISLAKTALRHAALALALVAAAAVTDEYRQSLSRARTGALADVGYDLAGGALALALRVAGQRAREALRKPPSDF